MLISYGIILMFCRKIMFDNPQLTESRNEMGLYKSVTTDRMLTNLDPTMIKLEGEIFKAAGYKIRFLFWKFIFFSTDNQSN
jgi:hypothetical protein